MKKRLGVRPIDLMVLALIGALVVYQRSGRETAPVASGSPFAKQVDLEPLHQTAVQADGRLRSFESHAKTFVSYVTGPRLLDGQSFGFTYLDLLFRPESYTDKSCIYVKSPQVRERIIEALGDRPETKSTETGLFRKQGWIAPKLLADAKVVAVLRKLGEDLIRTAKSVDAIQSALTVANPRFLLENLRVVPSSSGDPSNRWISLSPIVGPTDRPMDDIHGGVRPPASIPGLDADIQNKIRASWSALQSAWKAEDVAKVNSSIVELANLFPAIAPNAYPSPRRLGMESWYFRSKSMTWVWWFYAAATVPLLLSVIYGWQTARRIGIAFFCLAFVGHSASLGIRWYISGRWPNSNMFEAVHTSAWLGGLASLVLEWVVRRKPVRNLFALGSSAVSAAALMAAYFLPAQLDSTINNKMAALNDVWLYIHTNMIILSYALIAIACVTALLLLRHRWCLAWDSGSLSKARLFLLPLAIGVANYVGYLLLMHVIDNVNRGLSRNMLMGAVGAFSGSLLILLFEMLDTRGRSRRGAFLEKSATGGASSLILGSRGTHPFLKDERPSAGEVLDGATMVMLELSFITLWTGIVMGAIWADHSWGRPWGWDPKEVFALNTFFIFLILIHVRLKVRDKAFWTAVLAVIGFEVMMFNWIVVNFIISGLHSYA
ncbi:MAG: cytochrome c biogenesis protein CcsA [Planctomycetota bacterium]